MGKLSTVTNYSFSWYDSNHNSICKRHGGILQELVYKSCLIIDHDKIPKLGLPHFHENFRLHKRKGQCCSCRQQWGLRVKRSHLRTHKNQTNGCHKMYGGRKIIIFNKCVLLSVLWVLLNMFFSNAFCSFTDGYPSP